MSEKILIAVDESAAAGKAVEYVGRIFGGSGRPSIEITLFHVAESIPSDLLPKASDPAIAKLMDQAMKDWNSQAIARSDKLLAKYRATLAKAGIPTEEIHAKSKLEESLPEARRVAAAQVIIKEVGEGGYSTVVLGRRGTSADPKTPRGSTSMSRGS